MSERTHRQPEQRRAEQRYGTRGQQTGGQMGRAGAQTVQTGGTTSQQFGQQAATTGQPSPEAGWQQGAQMGGQQARAPQARAPIRPMTVSDIAATDVVTTSPDAPVTQVAQQMATENVGSVVVVQQHSPVGIVTDRKIALALGRTLDVSQMQVRDLMSEGVFTVPENTNVFDLVQQLSARGFRRAPVVDDQGTLRGIVSLDDAIVLLAEEFHNVGQLIRNQSPRL